MDNLSAVTIVATFLFMCGVLFTHNLYLQVSFFIALTLTMIMFFGIYIYWMINE